MNVVLKWFFSAVYWVESSVDQAIPRNAVESGVDADGSKIYVGLAVHEGDEIAAKIIPEKRAAYVAYDGKEHFVKNYKVSYKKYLYQKLASLWFV